MGLTCFKKQNKKKQSQKNKKDNKTVPMKTQEMIIHQFGLIIQVAQTG